jgi:hypothetical protein
LVGHTPGGGREIVSKKRKITEREKIVDRNSCCRGFLLSKHVFCVAGSNYF